MRDVVEVYRTIQLHTSQWPVAVVHTSETHACIDTCIAFRASPSNGAYGLIANAGAELLHTNGIGPLDKWVDDHVFLRIPLTHLTEYNCLWRQWHTNIIQIGQQHTRSGIWYSGATLPNGVIKEFSENCLAPIKNLSNASPWSVEDARFSYCITDIDKISHELGIPWETSKAQPFTDSMIYIGFTWNLKKCTVALSEAKVEKYAGNQWMADKTETHAQTCARIVWKITTCGLHRASRPRLPDRARKHAFNMRQAILSLTPPQQRHSRRPSLVAQQDSHQCIRPIFPPATPLDPHTFSDASSGLGIGIVIGTRWRAWRLWADWSTLHGRKDIRWAKAVGFELLIRMANALLDWPTALVLHGNNTGILDGWHIGRHHNHPVNSVFKSIHAFLESAQHILSILPHYVASAENPADLPSRGIYGHPHLLLPPLVVPEHAQGFLTDATDPLSARELRELWEGKYSTSATRTLDKLRAQQQQTECTWAEAQLEEELIIHVLHHDWLHPVMLQLSPNPPWQS